jgi:hypothetical protein
MQYIFDNGVYKIARITGPQHNLLGIRLSDSECMKKIVPLPIKDNEPTLLESDEVLNQVEAGLIAINKELKRKYYISEIQFVPSDTNSPYVYSSLLKELIKRIDCKGDFIEAK